MSFHNLENITAENRILIFSTFQTLYITICLYLQIDSHHISAVIVPHLLLFIISPTDTQFIPYYYYIFSPNLCPSIFSSASPPVPPSAAKLSAYVQNQSQIFTAHVRHLNASLIW